MAIISCSYLLYLLILSFPLSLVVFDEKMNKDFQEARKLLLEAVETVIAVTNSSPSISSSQDVASTQTQSSLGIKEHNKIFGFRRPKGTSKGKGKSSKSRTIRKNTTWKKECVYLKDKNQTHKPSAEEKIELAQLGLGMKKLEFNINGNAQDIHDVIIDSFPILEVCGGYTLLRLSDNSHKMVEIECPCGITVPFLRDVLNQAKLYIRPLQKDI
jgi:hypothetical protein